ncbi:carbon-nitrogen hydrolase [Triangularia verruculosa]|uniref:nitrilase n=1 Tax=Triangularia verruculosa TaxID=2587418 RepID=A0AAN6X9T8_9PEZI|nr:carbon-nitrogen hydrolase [Triangularia verruculosa]
MAKSLRVAVIQSEPVYLDLTATIEKSCRLIAEAAKSGAKLVAFPECWAPGYPAWIWARLVDTDLHPRYIFNALPVNSQAMDLVKAAAKDHSIAVVLGFAERSQTDSVYISQAIISPRGELLVHRRKIKPTHMERTIFGDGSGNDLNNVVDIDFGPDHGKVKGETIHVAMWPPVSPMPGADYPGLWSMTAEGCQNLSQTYAIESTAYVLHSTAVCHQQSIELLRTQQGIVCSEPGGGHSCVIAPDGRRLTAPLGDGTARGFLDVVGHYSRPDLLWLGVDKRQKQVVISGDPTQSIENREDSQFSA